MAFGCQGFSCVLSKQDNKTLAVLLCVQLTTVLFPYCSKVEKRWTYPYCNKFLWFLCFFFFFNYFPHVSAHTHLFSVERHRTPHVTQSFITIRMSRIKQPLEHAKEFAASVDASEGDTAAVTNDDEECVQIAVPNDEESIQISIDHSGAPDAAALLSHSGSDKAGDATALVTPPPAAQPLETIHTAVVAERATTEVGSGNASKVPSITISPKSNGSMFINGVDDQPLAYASEQEVLNMNLRSSVLAVEAESVKLAERFLEDLQAMKKSMDALNPKRVAALNEYTKIFAWPPIKETPSADIARDNELAAPVDVVHKASKELSTAIQSFRDAPAPLDELTKPVLLLKRRAEIQSSLDQVSRLLLNDNEITEDVVVRLHEISQGDVFSFTRSELNQKQRELDALRDDLATATSGKKDALMTGDVRAAESFSYREIDIYEKIIARLRDRVQTILMCDSDVKEYCDKYQKTHELADVLLEKHQSRSQEWAASIAKDISKLSEVRKDMTQQDTDDEDAHAKKMEDTSVAIRSVNEQQMLNWEKICELMEFNRLLSTQRERLVTEQVALHAAEVHRRAAVDAWFAGSQDYLTQLEDAQSSAATSLQWVAQLRAYVNQLCTQVESKRIDEEAWQLRVQEQLEYLDAYKNFKTLVGEISHRKELRIISLQRVVRNLQLQIKEAVETLDPHTKKYEKEVEVANAEIGAIERQLGELKERSAEQQKMWKLVEESLEDAQVDFIPPDIATQKELCEKKTQALNVARQFVVAEQETVDKDTMKLRKLKTANQVAIDGLQKRRADRSVDGESSVAAIAAAPSS